MSPSRYRRFLWALFCSLIGASLSALDTATPATPVTPATKGADIEQKLVRDRTRPAEQESVTTSYAPVVERILPSVVSINTYSKVSRREWRYSFDLPSEDLDHLPPYFREFFGDWLERRDWRGAPMPRRPPASKPVQTGLGSGVILTADGYILTNYHVVAQADDLKIDVAGHDRPFSARVIGSDPQTDVALVKVDASGLTPATIGDSAMVRVGDVVLAVGSPMGLEQSVTQGIVSGLGRSDLGIIGRTTLGQPGYENFIQTDAAINPGNSGGPLLDAHGRVVGLNAAIETRSGMFAGIGLAIPINMAISVMRELVDEGKVHRGFLGIEMDRMDAGMAELYGLGDGGGVMVISVVKDSAAEQAGVQEGDALVTLNGQKVVNPSQVRLTVSAWRPGTEVHLGVVRYDEASGQARRLDLTARLRALPDAAAARTDESSGPMPPAGLQRGFLDGVVIEPLTASDREAYGMDEGVEGVVVVSVKPDSAASRGGLAEGDVILQVNRQPVKDVAAAEAAVSRAGGRMVLKIFRDGRTKFLAVSK